MPISTLPTPSLRRRRRAPALLTLKVASDWRRVSWSDRDKAIGQMREILQDFALGYGVRSVQQRLTKRQRGTQ